MASCGGGSSSGSGSPVPSVIERLGNLRPSKELLEYYRRKLAEYDKDHEVLTGKLDQFKFSFEEQGFDEFNHVVEAGSAYFECQYNEKQSSVAYSLLPPCFCHAITGDVPISEFEYEE